MPILPVHWLSVDFCNVYTSKTARVPLRQTQGSVTQERQTAFLKLTGGDFKGMEASKFCVYLRFTLLSSRDQKQRENPCKSIYLSQTQRELTLNYSKPLTSVWNGNINTLYIKYCCNTAPFFPPHNTSLISRQPDHKYEWVQTAQLFVGLFHVLCNIL